MLYLKQYEANGGTYMDNQGDFTKEDIPFNNINGTTDTNNYNPNGYSNRDGFNNQTSSNTQNSYNPQNGYNPNNQAGYQNGYNPQNGYYYPAGYNNMQNGYNYQNPAGYQPGYMQPQVPQSTYGIQQSETNGLAIASLVLSILSVLSFLILFSGNGFWFFLSIICSIIGTILGACSKNKTGPNANKRPGVGLAGLILGLVMLAINVLIFLIAIILVANIKDFDRFTY